MSLNDYRGMPLSTDNPESLARYEGALHMLHTHCGDPLAVIDRALADDPAFVMGHCLRAALFLMAGDEPLEEELRRSVVAAEALLQRANARERGHIAAARAWLEGDWVRSVRLYGEVLIDYPRDSLALQVAHFGDFLLGKPAMLRDRVAQVLPCWDESVPGYGYVLGLYAFGLEETALYERAERTARRALALDRRNPSAIHAVTHVMEMQGRQAEGIAWLKATAPDWAENTRFSIHNWWHLALFHLDLDEAQEALAIYDERIRGCHLGQASALVDASALLWRLHLRGVDLGERWRELAACWHAKTPGGPRPFNDAHAMMAFVAGAEDAGAQRLLTALRSRARTLDAGGRAVREVGLPLCEALLAFGQGDYRAAAERLETVRHIAHGFGGSHAQRDLIHLTLVESALRSYQPRLARALAAERTALKPTSRFNWALTTRAEARLENAGVVPGPRRGADQDFAPWQPAGNGPVAGLRQPALQG